MQWLGDAGLIAGGAATVGTVLGILKRAGLIHLSTNGKKKEPEGCPDAVCNQNVHDTSVKVQKIDETLTGFQKDVYGKLDNLNNNVSNMRGYLEGKFGKAEER